MSELGPTITELEPTITELEPTAIERLRALLDEHGVEWRGGLPTETMVEADGLDLLYVGLPDGRVRAFIRNYLTPEQAIEATLGSGECRNTAPSYLDFLCSECGFVHYHSDENDSGGGNEWRYCPNCGARVVSDDD